jgi:hypothetical protein
MGRRTYAMPAQIFEHIAAIAKRPFVRHRALP